MNSICIISVYFGKFNNYFDLWLRTCAYNQKIDFLIVTDADYDKNLPANVKILRKNIDDVREMASKATGVHVALYRPYKCCDLKPFYGLIFQQFIKDYEYWGECDMDLMWGDLYSFLTKNNYKSYDKFSPLGHLSLYRNTPENNERYKLAGVIKGGWQYVLKSEKNEVFDEQNGIGRIYIENNLPFFNKQLFADITPLHYRFTISPFSTINEKSQKNYRFQIFYWREGCVYRDYFKNGRLYTDEFMYIHFRGRDNYKPSEDVMTGSSFYITPKGFIPKITVTTKDIINEYNPCPSLIQEKLVELKFRWDYQFRRIKRLFSKCK